jgi:hypothetical protein
LASFRGDLASVKLSSNGFPRPKTGISLNFTPLSDR